LEPTDRLFTRPLTNYDLSLNETLAVAVSTVTVRHGRVRRTMSQSSSSTRYRPSPAFSWVVIIHQSSNSWGRTQRPEDVRVEEDEHKRFGLLRELHAVRDFQSALHVDIQEDWEYYMVRLLNESVAAGRARGEFGDLFPEPLVTYSFMI